MRNFIVSTVQLICVGWGLKHGKYIFYGRFIDHEDNGNIQMEVDVIRYSWKCEYCGLKKIVDDNDELNVFIICQKLRHVQVIKKYRTHTYS